MNYAAASITIKGVTFDLTAHVPDGAEVSIEAFMETDDNGVECVGAQLIDDTGRIWAEERRPSQHHA